MPIPTTLPNLQSALTTALSSGSLVLDKSLLDASLLQPFPAGSIPLESVTITPKPSSLVVTAEVTAGWQPDGLKSLTVSPLKLAATFTQTGGAIKAVFRFSGSVAIGAGSVSVSGAVKQGALQFSLASEQSMSLAAIAAVVSDGEITPALPALAVLDTVTIETLDLSFAFDGKTDTEIKLVAKVSKDWTVIPKLLIVGGLQVGINVSVKPSATGPSLFFGGSLSGTITGAATFKVEVPFKQGSDLDLIITPADGAAAPTLQDAAGLVGGDPLRASMDSALAALKLSEIGVDKLDLSFDTATRKPMFATVDGHLEFATIGGTMSVQIPLSSGGGFVFNASFAQKQPIAVGKLVGELATRYIDGFELPGLLQNVTISDLSFSASSSSNAITFGFDSQITPAPSLKLATHIEIGIAKSAAGFEKTLSGYVDFNGLHFGLDLESGPELTAFTATFNNSQNSPSNVDGAGFGALVPDSGTLSEILAQLFPAPIISAVPAALKSGLDAITVSDGKIAIGSVAVVSYQAISFGFSKEKGSKAKFNIGFDGGVEIKGLADLRGHLQIDIGDKNQIEFVAADDSGELVAIPVPLPVSGTRPELVPKVKSVRFSKSAASFTFATTVAVQFKGFSGLLDKILPDSAEATLTLSNKVQSLTIDKLTDGVEIDLPGIPVPGSSDVELGTLFINLTDFTVSTAKGGTLSVDLGIGLPSKLNNLFGTTNGKPTLELFDTFDPGDPENSVLKARIAANSKSLSLDLLTSPLKAIAPFVRDNRAWWEIDMGKFGAAEVMVPTFSYKVGGTGLTASGGFDITRPLAIPLTPLKNLLRKVTSDTIADAIPDSVPIKGIDLIDANKDLNVGEFKKLWGGNFPSELDAVIDVINDGLHKLPDRMTSYFNIVIPQSLLFDIQVDGSGGVQGSLAVNDGDPPIRFLYPGMAGALPALCGVELRKIAFGEILSGQLFTLEIDATFDQFSLLTIAAALALPEASEKILPPTQKLQTTVELNNLYAIIFYQTGIPIPIPLFYDRIGLGYVGFEGVEVGSQFSFPKPSANPAELAKMLSQIVQFFTIETFLLEVDQPPEDADLKFTIGGNFLQLPKYVGGKLLGQKTQIAELSAWSLLAHALNWLKTFSAREFVQSFPIEKRVGSETIEFFDIADIDVAWAFTTPSEFQDIAFKKLKIAPEDREGVLAVLPKNADPEDEGLVLFLRGGFKIADVVKFDSTFGIMGSSSQGFATGFAFRGNLASIVSAEISGAIALNPKAQPSFQLIGKTQLSILGNTVMSGDLFLSNEKLQISGLIDLFPGSTKVTARATIQGLISSEALELLGNIDFAFGSVTIIKGQLLLGHDRFFISGQFLGAQAQLDISKAQNAISIAGTAKTDEDFDVKTGKITILGAKVTDGITIGVKAGLTLGVTVSANAFSLEVLANFTINNKGFNVSVTLSVVPSEIDAVIKKLSAQIKAEAEKYFLAQFSDANAWLQGVASGAIAFAGNTANNAALVFKDAYKTSAQQATSLLKSAGHGAAAVGGALKDVFSQNSQQAARLLKNANFAAGEVAKALASAYATTAAEATRLLRGVGYAANEVGSALSSVYQQGAQQAARLLRGAGYAASDVATAMKSAFNQGAQSAASLLRGAGYAANEVGRAMQAAFGQSAQAVANLLKGAGFIASDVGGALRSVFGFNANQTAQALKQAGYLANDVGKALGAVFGVNANSAAAALKSAGYTANQIGGALKNGFASTPNDAAKALRQAGFGASQVGEALKGTFTNSATDVARALKFAGFAPNEAANVLKNVFNAPANTVADALKSVWGESSSSVENLLKQAGFSSNAINSALKDIFNIIPFVKIPHIKRPSHFKIF